MRERPILFSGPMVRAIIEGRKTQTRRVVKGMALEWLEPGRFTPAFTAIPENGLSPFGFAGDLLWVRESGFIDREKTAFIYAEFCGKGSPGWKSCPSIHMPRWASRITLAITGVRIERLHQISRDDCIAEGMVAPDDHTTVRGAYQGLWNALNAKRGHGWDMNPWVWVIEFTPSDSSKLATKEAPNKHQDLAVAGMLSSGSELSPSITPQSLLTTEPPVRFELTTAPIVRRQETLCFPVLPRE